MRRSSWLNIGCIIMLSAAVLLFFNQQILLGLGFLALAAVLGVMAGQAMTTEPHRPSRSDDDE